MGIDILFLLWNVAGILFFSGLGLFLIGLSLATVTDYFTQKIRG